MLNASPNPVAGQFARFLTGLRFEDLPASAIKSAKNLILDQIGCEIVGSTVPWVEPAVSLASLGAGGTTESTVVNRPLKLLAADAAFVNATFGHACELDDAAYGASGHIGSAAVPAAIAVGERQGVRGRDVATAVVGGYEIMYRLLAAVAPHNSERGFHSQSIGGPFAAAAAAGLLLRLDEARMQHALAIAGSHSCGTMEYDQSGGEVKRVHAGIAARGGVQSALLAHFGLTGPATIVEGKRGFINVFADRRDASRLTDGLGETLAIHNVSFKMYPALGMAHTSIAAATRLAKDHDVKPEDVAGIRVRLTKTGAEHSSTIRRPSDAIGAQFSMAFSVALAICRRQNVLSDYMSPQAWIDPEIVRLIDLVDIGEHPDAHGKRLRLADVEIELKGGRKLLAVEEHMKGTPPNPASPEELLAKMKSLAGSAFGERQVDRIVEAVDGIDRLGSIGELTRLLGGPLD